MITIHLPNTEDARFLKFQDWVQQNIQRLLNSGKGTTEIWDNFRKKNVYPPLKELFSENQGFLCCYCGSPINKKEQSDIEHLKPKTNYPNLIFEIDNLFASCSSSAERCTYIVSNADVQRFRDLQDLFEYFTERFATRQDELQWWKTDGWESVASLKKLSAGLKFRLSDKPAGICNNKKNAEELPFDLRDVKLESYFAYDSEGSIVAQVSLSVKDKYQEALDNTLNLNESTFLKSRRKSIKDSEEAYIISLYDSGMELTEIQLYLHERVQELKTPNDYKELKPYYFVSLFVLEQYKAI